MPNDEEVGSLLPGGQVIVNLSPPDPLADLGSMRENPTGVGPGWYAAGPSHFVGAFPMRQDLTILPLPADRDLQNSPVPDGEPFVIHETDMSQLRFETPVGADGQVLMVGDGGEPQWGPAPSHLYSDSDGGMVQINQASSFAEGDIRFHMQGGLEVIRIAANGDFFVHGRKVDNDHEIYQHFRKFLGMSYNLPAIDPRPRDGIETRYERILKQRNEDQ